MTSHPAKVSTLILLFLGFLIFYSCSKDIDILTDAILNDEIANVDEKENVDETSEEESEAEENTETEETPEEEPPAEDGMEDGFESRITEFPPIDDAHVQSGKGYNQTIIRLDENSRTSYLKFDLSPIEAIGGYITDATLEFTINSDEGNGTISIYKGLDSDWTEQQIDNINVPEIDILLGTITKEYKIGNTEEVILSASDLIPENTTLILQHNEGNDLAIASKEHPSKIGPKLVITYNVPEIADAIVIVEEETAPTAEENNPEEENNPAENEAPMAIADASPSSGGVPLQVTFTGSNSSDDNSIVTYTWDFKDGSSSNAANPVHTFMEVGNYEAELTVTDEDGLNSTDTVTITVNEESNAAPVARATASPLTGTAPLEVAFTGSNSSDDNSVASYSWDFKDGGSANNANPTHTFNNAGTYEVELTVTDENGLSDKATVNITVNAAVSNEAPVAVAAATPISGDAPLQVQFDSSGSTDDKGISNRLWNFTPNDASSQANPIRTFDNPGVYEVTLTVTDTEGLTDTDTVTITVNSGGGGSNTGGGNYPPGAVLASSFGFNSNDSSEAFKDALQSNNSVIVIDKQSSDWIIKPTKIFSLENKTIIFESGVVLRAKPGAYPNATDQMLQLVYPENITIEGYGATFRMNKSEYTNGEHRHALTIQDGDNITVKGLVLRDAGGDGILISGLQPGTYSNNVTIEDVTCVNNRRNGLSITSGQNIWVRNSDFSQSNGHNPETGVDLEPNYTNDRLVNINFNNCTFSGNDSAGFQVATLNMNSSSLPLSVNVVDCDFSFNSKSPNGKPKSEIITSAGTVSNAVGGQVKFIRNDFNGSSGMLLFSKKKANAYKVIFEDCNATNFNSSLSVISLEALSTANTLGNFTFDNFYIQYNSNKPFMQIRGPSNFTVKDIIGTFTIKEPYDNPLEWAGAYNPSNNVNVSINYNHIN